MVAAFALMLYSTTVLSKDISQYELLNAIGVSVDLTANDAVTRGEAARYFTEITGNISPDGNFYLDVDKNHMNFEAINNVTNLGIMNGDANGKFYPDNKISGKDFLASVVRLAGFTDYAEATGGYPTGYINIASRYKLIPKDFKLDEIITNKQVAEILYDAITMPYCDASGFIKNGDNFQIDYDIDNDFTVLKHYRTIVKVSGVLASVDEVRLNGYKASGKGMIGLSDGENITYYKSYLTGAQNFLGCFVNCLYDENDEKILFIEPQDNVEKITLTYRDIYDISSDRTTIKYYDGKKNRDIKIPYDATFIYNGSNYNNITVPELHKPNVRITAIDVDSDKSYEVIFVEEHETIVVGSYVVEKQSVSDRRTGKTYCFDDEEFENGVHFFMDGNEVDFKSVHIGCVLTVLTDKEETKRNIYINDAVTGKVEEISSSDNMIKLGGNYYNTLFELDSSSVSPGDYVSLFINHYGYCSDYEKKKFSGGEYVYLIAIAEEGGLTKKVKCKYVNASGEIVVGELDEKFTVNSIRSDYNTLYANLMSGGELHQLVYIKFKGDKIKNIDTANVVDGLPTSDSYDKFTLNYSATAGNCLVYGTNINAQFFVPSTTQTFYIPVDDFGNVYDDEILAGDYEDVGILSGTKPKIKIYDSTFSRIPGAIVIYGIAGKETNYLSSGRLKGTNAFVVEEIYMKLYEDGEVKPAIKGMILGMPKTMYPADYLNIDDLKPGDVIKMGNYRGNELRSYEKLFTQSRDKKDAEAILSMDGLYSDSILAYNKTGTTSKISSVGVLGTVEEVGTTSSGTGVANQNDGTPKYSLIIRPMSSVDDSNLLTIPVTSWYNNDAAGTYIYVFNTRTNTAYAVSPMDIELTGKTVYCFTYDGLAKAIIIYDGGDK